MGLQLKGIFHYHHDYLPIIIMLFLLLFTHCKYCCALQNEPRHYNWCLFCSWWTTCRSSAGCGLVAPPHLLPAGWKRSGLGSCSVALSPRGGAAGPDATGPSVLGCLQVERDLNENTRGFVCEGSQSSSSSSGRRLSWGNQEAERLQDHHNQSSSPNSTFYRLDVFCGHTGRRCGWTNSSLHSGLWWRRLLTSSVAWRPPSRGTRRAWAPRSPAVEPPSHPPASHSKPTSFKCCSSSPRAVSPSVLYLCWDVGRCCVRSAQQQHRYKEKWRDGTESHRCSSETGAAPCLYLWPLWGRCEVTVTTQRRLLLLMLHITHWLSS